MDMNAYDAVTTALVNKILNQQKNMDKGVLRTCARLKKAAEEASDNTLAGFAYYQMADAYYSMEISYEKFRVCLKQALACLQAADDPDLLSRLFNYVAIDAMNHGCYDVAYYYYKMALRTCERAPDNGYHMCIFTANIGQLYLRLGDVKKARRYIRTSNYRRMKNDRGNIYFFHNMIIGYYLEAVTCIELGDTAGAVKLCSKMDSFEAPLDESADVLYLCDIARAETALLSGDTALFEERFAAAHRRLSGISQLGEFVDETAQFCRFLLAREKTAEVGKVLQIIGKRENTTTQAARVITAVESAYYEKTGDTKKAEACLRKRFVLAEQHEREQNGIYLYSIELIGTMSGMRRESARVQAENRILLEQSHTDALTGIANRLMMNRLVEEAFERAYMSGRRFGLEILDVNYFKEYNDTYGHREGDTCLVRIAEVLARLAEKEGIHCARYGGDEFVMIYEDMTDREILECARELDEAIRALGIANRSARYGNCVTVSQGICNDVPSRKNKSYDFLAEADNALYEVKGRLGASRGRNANTVCLRHLPDMFT